MSRPECTAARSYVPGNLRDQRSQSDSRTAFVLRSDRLFADTEPSASVAQCIPDLLDGSCDSSILAVSSLPDSDAVLVRLGSTYDVLCASPAYLSTHDMPAEPTDLLSHECLTLNTPTFPQREWDFDGPKGKKSLTIDSVLQFDNAEALAAAIRHGNGIGALPVHAALAGFGDGSLACVAGPHGRIERDLRGTSFAPVCRCENEDMAGLDACLLAART